MRVVDILLFASAFHVASIVCPGIPNQDPNRYRVLRMFKRDLPDVLAEYDTQVETPRRTYMRKAYYPVQRFLDVVVKGDRIIGSANHERILVPIATDFDHGRGRQYTTMRFRPSLPADNPKIMLGREALQLGMFDQLPANTIFESPLRRNVPGSRTIMHVDSKFNVIAISSDESAHF